MTTQRAAIGPQTGVPKPYIGIRSVRGPRSAFLWLRGVIGWHLSVRAKLTLWYGLMCGLTLGIAGSAMGLYLDRQFGHDIDGNLRSTSAALQQRFSIPLVYPSSKDSSRECTGSPPLVRAYCSRVDQTVAAQELALTNTGQIAEAWLYDPRLYTWVQLPPPGAQDVPPVDPDFFRMTNLFVQVASARTPQFNNVTYKGEPFRLYLSPLTLPNQVRAIDPRYFAILAVFQKERIYQDIRHEFLLVLLVGIPLGLIIALVAGWWIARAALRPIDRISRTVRSIGASQDLHRRLNFVGPTDEVGRLALTFDGMMERLERVFDTQKRFIADASHELRTPLTAIRGNADLMTFAPPEERDICLTSIRQEAERMSRLVGDLLLLAEADVAEQNIQKRPVELDDLLRAVHRSAVLLSAGKVEVVLEAGPAVCVDGDPDRLKQLLLNLADNAVKFTPKGGTVSMGVSLEGDVARLHVSDSGIGIPEEEQQSIFDRFYRVEASRARRGSGLGLAISAWIARAHGGAIQVSSSPGKGSTFSVTLPGARLARD